MAKTVIDVAEMRRLNKVTVLNAIRNRPETSRIAIAEATGLNKATVSSLVDQLIQEEFVCEIGLGTSSGGRKPIMLTLNANAAFSIGIDIQIHSMRLVLCNLDHEVKQEKIISIHPKPLSEAALVALVKSEIKQMLDNVPHSPHGVIGIGIALPGMVNYREGYVHYIPNLGLSDFPLAAILQEDFHIPIYIDNDANCGAWAEYRQYPFAHSLVYVNVGIGIGAGLVFHGQVHRGFNGLAGEYGHMTIAPLGLKCSCGNYGCWEQYASETGLYTQWLDSMGETIENASLPLDQHFVTRLLELADHGHHRAVHAFQQLGRYLGIGVANILNSLNPELVVLGGRISVASDYILPEIQQILSYRALPGVRGAKVVTANEPTRATGAASLVAEETLLRSFDAPK